MFAWSSLGDSGVKWIFAPKPGEKHEALIHCLFSDWEACVNSACVYRSNSAHVLRQPGRACQQTAASLHAASKTRTLP